LKNKEAVMAAFIGIDLGTTYSAVATIDDTGRPMIVANRDGQNITPSCVTENEGTIEVGEYARRTWGNAPERAASRFKRDMGTSNNHSINGREFSPTELSTFVLKKLLKDTEEAIGPVGEAVVTIPANFAHEARDATMAAAKAAGLNVKYIINEPTAAALYYAFKTGETLSGIYAVYDLGGGTFDVSIIRVDGQDIEVLASNGVSKLGGDDFDDALLMIVAKKYKQATGEEMESDDFTKNDAEEEKKSLSGRKRTTVKVGRELIDINREEFEEAISSKVTQAEMLCESTIEEAGTETPDIRGVFLAGGSTRIPLVQDSIRRVFKQEPVSNVNVDEVVSLGASLYSAYKGDQENLSAAQKNSISKISVSESTAKCFGTISIGHDAERDEAKLRNSILIRKGDKIPCSITESFYTVYDGQESVNCRVTESTAVESDPRFVKVIWEGNLVLPEGRDANQEIKVTFAYDENQIMMCSFQDVATGRETKIDLSMTSSSEDAAQDIDKFMVE
jgi:molecular chaperone DnaK